MILIDKAIQTAAIAHRNQTRKGSGVPYITHPYAVGLLLTQAGCREEVIAAGILHDTVEDTELTLQEIQDAFGDKVAEIVMGCSEPDKSLSWEERKRHTLEFLKTASLDICMVSCADKLHNVRSMLQDYQVIGEKLWTKFKRGREQQAWYYRSIVTILSDRLSIPLLEELRLHVEELFGS